MSEFGQDENGAYRVLRDGRCLRVEERMFNTLLTLSPSLDSPVWLEGW